MLLRDEKDRPTWKPYTKRLPSEEEIRLWLSDGKRNYGIIGGPVSGNLYVVDLDRPEAVSFLLGGSLEEAAKRTPIAFTGKRKMPAIPGLRRIGRGLHIYLEGDVPSFKIIRMVREDPKRPPVAKALVEVKGPNGYVVGPGSTHPSGLVYTWVSPPPAKPLHVDLAGLWNMLLPWLIAESILPWWQEGTRHDLLKGVAGYLRKRRKWTREDTEAVLGRIGDMLGVPEREVTQRVEETYRQDLKKVSMKAFLQYVWGKGAADQTEELQHRLVEVLDQEPKAQSAESAPASTGQNAAEPEKVALTPEEREAAAKMTLTDAVAILKRLVDNDDPFFHYALILGAAQDYVIDLLESVFYVLFAGGTNTGKGTATAVAMALTRNGVVLGSASPAALRDTLGDGRACGVSEMESLLKDNPELLGIMRNGNRRATSKVRLKIPEGKNWVTVEVDTFGYKVLDKHERLDTHVTNRALTYEMETSKNLDIAMNAEFHVHEWCAPIRRMLAFRAERAKAAGWDARKVIETWDSAEFRARVKTFRNAYARQGIIAAYLLLLNDMFEFDLEEEMRVAINAREVEISEVGEEVREAIEALAEGLELKPDMQMSVPDILTKVNQLRKERGLNSRNYVTGGLRDHQFSAKKQDWVPAKKNWSGPHRGHAIVLPYEHIIAWRAEQGDIPQAKSGKGSKGSTPHMEDATHATHATLTSWEHLPIVHGILAELGSNGERAQLDDVVRMAREREVPPAETERILNRLKKDGDLVEFGQGEFRLTEAL